MKTFINRFKTRSKAILAIAAMAITLPLAGPAGADIASGPGEKDLTVEQRPMADLQANPSDLKVSVWVDHKDNTYRAGDKVILSVKANKDAYLTILDVGTSGKVHIIFPNKYQTTNRVTAGQVVQVPGADAHFDFQVTGPAGFELIKVFATTSAKPLIDPDLTSVAGPYKAVSKPAGSLAKDLAVVLREDTQNQWAEYSKVIKIVDTAPAAATSAPADAPPTPAAATGVTPATQAPAAAVTGTTAASSVQVTGADVPFNLYLRPEKATYKIGEKVRIRVTAEKDCRLTVLDVGTSGQVSILFPNRYQQNNQVQAGQTVVIPGDMAPVDYVLNGPEGVEALIGICKTDNKPVFTGTYDFQQNVYQPWGSSKAIAKDLAVTLRLPPAVMAHTAATFLVTK